MKHHFQPKQNIASLTAKCLHKNQGKRKKVKRRSLRSEPRMSRLYMKTKRQYNNKLYIIMMMNTLTFLQALKNSNKLEP
jgi:hypothetical protein